MKTQRIQQAERVEWKRGSKDRLETSDRVTWVSRCGRFKVERLDSRYGLPVLFLGVERGTDGEVVLYRGRSRAQAEGACVRASSQNRPRLVHAGK